jgi:hypothetical protein
MTSGLARTTARPAATTGSRMAGVSGQLPGLPDHSGGLEPGLPHLHASPREGVTGSKSRFPGRSPNNRLIPDSGNNPGKPSLLPHAQSGGPLHNGTIVPVKRNGLGRLPLGPAQGGRIVVKRSGGGHKCVRGLQEPLGLPFETGMERIGGGPAPPTVVNPPEPVPDVLESEPERTVRISHLPDSRRIPGHELPGLLRDSKLTPHRTPPGRARQPPDQPADTRPGSPQAANESPRHRTPARPPRPATAPEKTRPPRQAPHARTQKRRQAPQPRRTPPSGPGAEKPQHRPQRAPPDQQRTHRNPPAPPSKTHVSPTTLPNDPPKRSRTNKQPHKKKVQNRNQRTHERQPARTQKSNANRSPASKPATQHDTTKATPGGHTSTHPSSNATEA